MSSSPETESVMTCADCGASIYPEHVDRGLAARMGGSLLCAYCLAEKKKTAPAPVDEAPLSMVDETEVKERPSQGSIHGRSGGFNVAEAIAPDSRGYQRPLNQTGNGATRLRIFHSKMSDAAIHHLQDAINEWLDSDPAIEVKYATSTVGTWEGKHADPNLILTIFY